MNIWEYLDIHPWWGLVYLLILSFVVVSSVTGLANIITAGRGWRQKERLRQRDLEGLE